MVLRGTRELKVGDVIVFKRKNGEAPVIHRLVNINEVIQTKGDNNYDIVRGMEHNIRREDIVGKAVLRIPYLGYFKIFFVDYIFKPLLKK